MQKRGDSLQHPRMVRRSGREEIQEQTLALARIFRQKCPKLPVFASVYLSTLHLFEQMRKVSAHG